MSENTEDRTGVYFGILIMVGYPLMVFLYAGLEWLGDWFDSMLGPVGGFVVIFLPYMLIGGVLSCIPKEKGKGKEDK